MSGFRRPAAICFIKGFDEAMFSLVGRFSTVKSRGCSDVLGNVQAICIYQHHGRSTFNRTVKRVSCRTRLITQRVCSQILAVEKPAKVDNSSPTSGPVQSKVRWTSLKVIVVRRWSRCSKSPKSRECFLFASQCRPRSSKMPAAAYERHVEYADTISRG
jgi:hypothetical protein